MRTVTIALLMMIALSGCSILGGGGDDNTNADAPSAQQSVIQWDRDPSSIVFRAEVVGGEQTYTRKNEIPLCTIYGDNHVVWTVTDGSNQTSVLHDRLTDEQIAQFVEDLTLAFRIYDYTREADIASSGDVAPVFEQLTLNVNGIEFITDAFGGWDYDYFELLRQRCADLSQSPVIYEPTAAWISAEQVDYNPNAPSIRWDGAGRGLDLAELAASGEPVWVTDSNVRLLWSVVQSNPPDFQMEQGENVYQIRLEIPNVTIDSPPAPSGE